MSERTIDVSALVADTGELGTERSIVPESHRTSQRSKIDAMLANVDRLSIGASIGEGGRGVVHTAAQRGLDREVAVKTVRGERTDDAVAELLQEALVTGSLEHPNIVPIHYIGVDDAGDPFIVLKKIEGDTWDERLVSESLESNLRVLLEVINAVRFAHSRQVIHRDLKPANVMVGQFGEVYLLDWGLAVSLATDDDGLVPLASGQTGVAGTLGYMAPEMLTSEGLSRRTDVYLLGAVLYEVAVGRPPHGGNNLAEIVDSVLASQPDLDGIPGELAAIIGRAMSAGPSDRYASADELQAAIEQFLVHRDATELVDSTNGRLELLLEGCTEAPDRAQLYNLFGECRFGFREAMRRWPEGEGAARGLEGAVRAMVGFELAHGDPAAAERLLSELSRPPAELRDQVDEALSRARDKLATLAKLEADLDMRVAGGWRLFGAMLIAVLGIGVFGVAPLVSDSLSQDPSWGMLFALAGGFGAVLLIAGVLLRRPILSSRPNRIYALSIAAAWAATVVGFVAFWRAGAEPMSIRLIHPIVWFAVTAMLVGAVDRRLWPTPILMLALAVVVPTLSWVVSFYALLAAFLFAVVNLGWVSLCRLRESCDPSS